MPWRDFQLNATFFERLDRVSFLFVRDGWLVRNGMFGHRKGMIGRKQILRGKIAVLRMDEEVHFWCRCFDVRDFSD